MSRRKRMLDDLDDDIRDYIERETQDNIERGMAPDEARYAAMRKFGNVTRTREDTREVWSAVWFEEFAQDIRYGLLMLRKSPGFSAIVILTMALSIGATTAIFSVVDATLLHPLAYSHPEELVRLEDNLPGLGAKDVGLSVPEWHDFERSGIFEYVSPFVTGSVNLTGSTQPTRARFYAVAPSYFALLGVKPELGRSFDPNDHTPGFTLDVMISDGLWKRAYAADPRIIGKSLRGDNDLYRVVGVMPPGYHDPGQTPESRNTEVWAAAGFAADPAPPPVRSVRTLPSVIARMKPGLTIAQAQSRVDSLVASLQQQFPEDYPQKAAWSVRLIPLKETVVGNVRQSLVVLLGAVILVLLIACVNVANLLLARSSARGREMAVRQALGAARKRLVRQLLTESMLLSVLGGIAGVGILVALKHYLLGLVPESLPRLRDISIDWTVLIFALASSLAAGVIFGLVPALHVGRQDLTHSLKQEGRGSTGSGEQARTRRLLVVTEFALSLVLMIAAGLLLRSFWDLMNARLGFNPQRVMAVRLWLPIPNDPSTDIYGSAAKEEPFARELLRRGAALPGVEEIAMGDRASLPLNHDPNPSSLVLEGREVEANRSQIVERADVTPAYFHLLGMTLLSGRAFNDSDNSGAPLVAVINKAFADAYWPNGNPLGQRIQLPRQITAWVTIVGVVADARTESLADARVPKVDLSLYQDTPKELAIFLRGSLDAAATPVELREQVQSVDPELPVFGAQTLGEILSDSLSERRFSMEMIGLFALAALLLAGLGIFGVISYVVSERTHEIGIRLALGAQRTAILQMVLGQGLKLAIAGAAVGLVGALIVSHLMAGLLYGVAPTDPATFAAVTGLLMLVAVLACYIPAWRAVRVDPLIALRYE